MTFSDPLPATIAPVACMVCGALILNDPELLERHANLHALVVVAAPPATLA